MFDLGVGIVMILFEMICCRLFYEAFGEKRRKTRWTGMINLTFLSAGSVFLVAIFSEYFVVKIISVILLIAVLMFRYMNINFIKCLIIAILYEGIVLTTDYFAFAVNQYFFLSDTAIQSHYGVQGMLIVIVGKILLFLTVLVVQKQVGKAAHNALSESEWIRFLFFPLFTIIMITSIITTFEQLQNQAQANVFVVIAVGMAGMNIFVYYLIHDIISREKLLYEKTLFEMEVRNQAEVYRSIYANYDEQRKRIHEFKNEIICIEWLSQNHKYEELSSYISEISGSYENEPNLIDTNNAIINAVINSKYQESLKNNIVFAIRVNDLSDIFIEDDDIVVILSNLLNNAFEACKKREDDRVVQLKFLKEETDIIISVKNTFSELPVFQDGQFQTTKQTDMHEHGVGIKNVCHVIERYQGIHSVTVSDDHFLFSILIPNQKVSKTL